MNDNKVDVGLVVGSDYISSKELIQLSPMIDSLGYSQVSVPEIWGHDAISLLSIFAHTTRKTRLATGIVNMYSRTPALMAMTAASIDEVSRGRFILGLGLSGPKVVEHWHGQKYEKPLLRTREYVKVLRSILNRERVNYKTTLLGDLKDFRISIHDIRKDISIHIAALGPKNVELVAEIADGWLPYIMPLGNFKKEVKTMYSHLDKYGKDKNKFAITPFVLTLIGNEPYKRELLRDTAWYYVATMGESKDRNFYNQTLRRAGFEDEAIEIIEKYYAGDIAGSKKALTDEILDTMCITGSKDEAQEKLIEFINAGATCPLLSLPAKTKYEDGLNTYQTLAPVNLSI